MKSALLLSGGWDSAACFFKTNVDDLVFFSYGQRYCLKEMIAAIRLCESAGRRLMVFNLNLGHDAERRNFLMLAAMKQNGYGRVVVGSRNVLPQFDRYKDSNWWSLKSFGHLMNMQIELPITGWTKRRVVKFVQQHYAKPLYNCYNDSAEDDATCQCPNCVEMRSL